MNRSGPSEIRRAVAQLPAGMFVMTAAFENKRAGILVSSVCKCADEPLLIGIATRKGHPLEPLIRDSRRFAVCLLDPEDKLIARHFDHPRTPEDRHDPFDALDVCHLSGSAPVLRKSTLALDCEVYRHFDLEADHEMYIGLVLAARVGAAKG